VEEYNGSGWRQIGGPAAEIYGRRGHLAATDPNTGNVWVDEGGVWTQFGGPGEEFAWDDAGHLYGLSPTGVFVWIGGQSWAQIGGPAGRIYAGGNQRLYATNPQSGQMYSYNSTNGQWTQIGGPSGELAFGWATDSLGNLYANGGIAGTNIGGVLLWAGGTNWTKLGNAAGQIFAGGGLVAIDGQTGNVNNYNPTTKTWSQIGPPGGEKYAIAADDHFIYRQTSSGLFIWSGGLSWTQIGGPAADFAV
jgi:hypothetical protein